MATDLCGEFTFFTVDSLFTIVTLIVTVATFWLVIVQVVYQKRRTDADLVQHATALLRQTESLALERLAGIQVHSDAVRMLGQKMMDLTGIEMLHRRQETQQGLLDLIQRYLKIADCADGRLDLEPKEIFELSHQLAIDLQGLVRSLTFIETLRELYAIPGKLTQQDISFEARRRQKIRIEPTL